MVMSKDAALALKESLENIQLPHCAEIDTKHQKQTGSLEVWAEVSDELTDEQENEVYEALQSVVPETFLFNEITWDVDYTGLCA